MKVNFMRLKIGVFFFFLPFIIFFDNQTIIAQQHGDLIRIQGEEKIYLIQNGQRRTIASMEVFHQMGFKLEDVKELDAQSVMSIPEGPPLWSKEIIAPYPDGTLIRLKGKAQTYVIRGGRKCYIPDAETFQANGFQWDQVIEVDRYTFNKIPTGIPLPTVKPPAAYGTSGIPPPGIGQPGVAPPAIGTPGMPPSPYPSQPPIQTYPPSSTPSQPYNYPPPAQQPPSSPPYTPPAYPQPSYPPSTLPPKGNPPSSFIDPEGQHITNQFSAVYIYNEKYLRFFVSNPLLNDI